MYNTLADTKYYAYTGTHNPDEALETIVFVHGTAMDHSVWSHQSRYFAYHDYNVLAIDLPGHKFSEGALLSSIEAMADWLGQIINQSSGKNFHLVGHSMGALIALEAAASFNKQNTKLNSLALVGFSYPMTVSPQLMAAAENDPSQAYSMMTQWSHTSPVGGEPVPGFWSPGMQMSMMENSRSGAVYTDLVACDNYKSGVAAFDKIHCPILFISGQLDKMAPAKLAQQQAGGNEMAEIIMIPNCGHSIMSESPDGVLESLRAFIGENSR